MIVRYVMRDGRRRDVGLGQIALAGDSVVYVMGHGTRSYRLIRARPSN